jgi:hypothetical protein
MADALDSKSSSRNESAGSSPASGTLQRKDLGQIALSPFLFFKASG